MDRITFVKKNITRPLKQQKYIFRKPLLTHNALGKQLKRQCISPYFSQALPIKISENRFRTLYASSSQEAQSVFPRKWPQAKYGRRLLVIDLELVAIRKDSPIGGSASENESGVTNA